MVGSLVRPWYTGVGLDIVYRFITIGRLERNMAKFVRPKSQTVREYGTYDGSSSPSDIILSVEGDDLP